MSEMSQLVVEEVPAGAEAEPVLEFNFEMMVSNPYVKNRDFVELLKSMESSVGPIPRHVKNIFHLCGFTTTSIISSIGEKELRECQEYIIQADRELAPAVEEIYSTYYACPEKFRFTPGDIIIINKMIQYSKEGFRPETKPYTPRDCLKASTNETQDMLRQKIVSWLKEHEFHFTDVIVTISKNANTDSGATGLIVCPICGKTIKLSSSTGKKKRWIISNFTKHILSLHMNPEVNSCEDENEVDDCGNIVEKKKTMIQPTLKQCISKQNNTSEDNMM
ncbi:uncharacterized protein LOC129808426 [Phlebotomus papatasi]|uniref:uncharacterized protein LOC129808426 n=1 Tax=Phlebotomus papatasi TaxID=29031 RepID=UPI0024845039|nr:uncharacterized protein LOC129808426 [Phlebotomus papatasi]